MTTWIKIINRAPVRTAEFWNNVASGIIAGSIILYFGLLGDFNNVIKGLWFVPILWVLGFIGITIVTKSPKIKPSSRKKIRKNYCWNTLASLIGSIFLISYSHWYKIFSAIGLLVVFLVVMWLRNKYLHN